MPGRIFPYLRLLLGLIFTFVIAQQEHTIYGFLEKSSEAELLTTFFVIALICVLSFNIYYLTRGTVFPLFVTAIFFGMAAKPLLHPIIHSEGALAVLVGFGATLILFGGGLETPFKNFRKLFLKIASLSFIGLFLTALLLSLSIILIGKTLDVHVPIAVAVLLGAVLASTDPAAIIPTLKQLRFKKRDTKDIIISESALTDVTGTLLTVIFLSILLGGGVFNSVTGGYGTLFSADAGITLLKQIIFGVVGGIIGYALLEMLQRFKTGFDTEAEVDAAYFFFVPVIIFTFALALGGSGYLAAFVAGLIFIMKEHLSETEKFFNHTIDGFLKPMIFLLLGALVDIQSLIEYAGVGIIAALIFMFVIRPISVFISLSPFTIMGKEKMGWREMVFISFVRETGAIPAVLLVTIVSLGITGMDGLLSIGMWVILATLIIEPPLTPLVAKLLGVATLIEDKEKIIIDKNSQPFVVLGSRGRSFIERLPVVVDWADKHKIGKVMLLHCLEDNYTPKMAEEISAEAQKEFDTINADRKGEGKKELKFTYLSRKGFLQDNINELAKNEGANLTTIFVGKKVLDYRLSEIKDLAVPFYFIN